MKKLVFMSNKSRKGYYYYTKEHKMPGRYYKAVSGFSSDDAWNRYNDRYIKKIPYKGIRIQKKPTYKPKKITKQKNIRTFNIEKTIQPGRRQIMIRNIFNLADHQIDKAAQKLLHDAIKDKDLLRIMSQEDNLEKIKHRLEITATLYNESGQACGTFSTLGKLTIRKAIMEMRQLRYGSQMNEIDWSDSLRSMFPNWATTHIKKEGYLRRIEMTVKFRKARK